MNVAQRQCLAQTVFKNIYDFFSSHPNYTIIALQYGLTSSQLPSPATATGAGTGTGYYDAASYFGYNAFFVTRANATP